MCENDIPKVIVDDDFLDLRNDQARSRKRPSSAQSTSRGSPSVTQGNVSTVKEVLPGLKRILSNYNQKNANVFGYKKNHRVDSPPVDCRFRRKVEKKALSSRSESILQESESKRKETSTSQSSNLSIHDHLSESEKRESSQVKSSLFKVPQKEESKTKNEISRFKTETILNRIAEKPKKIDSLKKESRAANEIHKKDDAIKKISVNRDKKEKNLNQENLVTKEQGTTKLETTKLETTFGYYPIPNFKKSWTVPSLPLIKKNVSWTRHYNALCAKVDRKTYEFDTDDTLSDSEDNSAYSSISRSNYMNLIFCLGCLSGIFLIGGILTASEIHTDYLRPLDSEEGMMEFFYDQVSHTLRAVLNIFQQIITLPKLSGASVKQPKHWGVF